MLSSILESDIELVATSADQVDYFIIGSGTAGVTAAVELAGAGFNVVIIEAGPFVQANHIGSSPFRSQSEIVPKIHALVRYDTSWVQEDCYGCRETTPLVPNNTAWSLVGGRTVFWGGCAPRFNKEDFADWPFSYDEFAPYYDQAEKLMAVSGTSPDRPHFISSEWQDAAMERLNEKGFHAIHAPVGVDTARVANGHISFGFDSSVARLLRSGALVKFGEKQGVSLIANTAVTSLEASGDAISKLHLLNLQTKKQYEIKPKNVILACGGVQSTRLVLASGIEKDSDVVGKYISDHLFVQGLMRLREPIGVPLYILLAATEKLPYQVQIQGAFEADWYSPYHSTVWLDYQKEGTNVLFYCFGVGSVERKNRVEIHNDGECARGGASKYCVVYDHSAEDKQLIQRMIDGMPAIAEALNADVVRVKENPPGSALHEIGGLRMGTDPATSITNPDGRFWRFKNLFCHDSSTWRYQGAANPYLTITACSLRLARKLIEAKQPSLARNR